MQSVKPSDYQPLVLPTELTQENQAKLIQGVQRVLNSGARSIRIDCSEIENATSSHIGLLWKMYDVCKSNGLKLTLENATTSLVRVLIILDLGELFGLEGYENELRQSDRIKVFVGNSSDIFEELIPVSSKQVRDSVEAFVNFLKGKNLSELVIFEVRTVVYEIFTNIIEHSGLTPEGSIKFFAGLEENSIKIVIEDTGIEFNPTLYKGSSDLVDLITAAKDRKFKGFGLLMIRKLVDTIKYERRENMINHLEVEKNWN